MFKRSILAFLFFFLLSVLTIFVAPIGSNFLVKNFVNKSELVLSNSKKLQFYDAFMLSGKITNRGRFDFKKCVITLNIYKPNANPLKNAVNRYLKPLLRDEFFMDEKIPRDESSDFRFLIEDFKYNDFATDIDSRCY